MPFTPDNPFWEGFETDPMGQRANYFSRLGNLRSPSMRRFFEKQFEETQNKYLGLVGRQVREEGQPDLTWSGYLDDWFNPSGGAQEFYASMSPRQRGSQSLDYAPPARWFV